MWDGGWERLVVLHLLIKWLSSSMLCQLCFERSNCKSRWFVIVDCIQTCAPRRHIAHFDIVNKYLSSILAIQLVWATYSFVLSVVSFRLFIKLSSINRHINIQCNVCKQANSSVTSNLRLFCIKLKMSNTRMFVTRTQFCYSSRTDGFVMKYIDGVYISFHETQVLDVGVTWALLHATVITERRALYELLNVVLDLRYPLLLEQ
jgi:hypothetical protein